MEIKMNDRVTVAHKNLHGNTNTLEDGQIVGISGASIKVHIDGEDLAREFPVEAIRKSSSVYGYDSNQYNGQVTDAIIRR